MSHKVWQNNFIQHREDDASRIVDSSRFDQISQGLLDLDGRNSQKYLHQT